MPCGSLCSAQVESVRPQGRRGDEMRVRKWCRGPKGSPKHHWSLLGIGLIHRPRTLCRRRPTQWETNCRRLRKKVAAAVMDPICRCSLWRLYQRLPSFLLSNRLNVCSRSSSKASTAWPDPYDFMGFQECDDIERVVRDAGPATCNASAYCCVQPSGLGVAPIRRSVC